MGFDSRGLDDYIDVAQRIAEFRAKHPEGSLQPLNPEQPFEIRELTGTGKDGKEARGTFIIYVAAAYRSPDDQRPGVGCAYEVFPGRTPYTAGSELQNAETAAWGRAIVAVLAADTRAGIASQQEVRNRQAERDQPAPARQPQNGNRNGAQRGSKASDAEAIDPEAQAFADEAHKVTDPKAIEGIHKRAREAGKLTGNIRNPASGGIGKLALYLDWRRKHLRTSRLDADDPWAVALRDAADATEAERLLADLRDQAGRGEIDPARATLVEQAAEELFPGITAAQPAAA